MYHSGRHIPSGKYAIVCLAVLLLAGAGQTATALAAGPGGTSPPKVPAWTGLTYVHAKMLGQLTVNIQLQSLAPMTDGILERVGAGLAGSSQTAKRVRLMAVDMRAEGLAFVDEQYTEKIWFDASDGRAYRRIRWLKGGDPWVKIYSWAEKGVRRKMIQPAGRDEPGEDPIKWTKITESFYPYPGDVVHPEAMSDPTLLLYLLSVRVSPNLNSPVALRVFGKQQLHRLTCRPEKPSPLTASYKARSSSGVVAVNTTITPFVFSVEVESSASRNRNPEKFSFLGLQKDIRIYLDPSTGLPIRISGRNSIWGELVLDLSDAQLN